MLGGLGSLAGATIGALLIGMGETLTTAYISPQWQAFVGTGIRRLGRRPAVSGQVAGSAAAARARRGPILPRFRGRSARPWAWTGGGADGIPAARHRPASALSADSPRSACECGGCRGGDCGRPRRGSARRRRRPLTIPFHSAAPRAFVRITRSGLASATADTSASSRKTRSQFYGNPADVSTVVL